jgi:choline-glycine betaine transporter
MTSWEIVILAAASMVVSDVLSVVLVQAEARNKANLSGVMDTLGWGASIIVTFATLHALGGTDMALKVAVIVAVSAANYFGSWWGVVIGKRFVSETATTLAERVARLEQNTRFVDPPKGTP